MRLVRVRTITGPNVYHRRGVLVATIDLDDLRDIESRDVPRFNAGLLAALPGLHEHRCSRGHRGGFVERLNEGTYFAHIVEHVALELSGRAGI
jgi:cyanophycin synthetase